MTKHEVGCEMMRELVHRRGRVTVSRPQTADKPGRKQDCAVVVDRGIPEISSDGVTPVLFTNALEILRYFVKRFVPTDALPTTGSAAHRIPEPIFIVMNILERDSFRADEAATEWIVFVAANGELIVLDGDLDTAHRFTNTARAEMGIVITHGNSL